MDGIPAPQLAPGRSGHVAVFTFPAYAHIAPALPTLTELVRRGHRVTCFVVERFAEKVRAAGVEAVVYESSFPWADGPTGSVLENMLDFFEEALAPLSAAVAHLEHDRPDLIAHDLAASEAARMLARGWDVPVLQLCPTIASSPEFSMSERQGREASPPADPIDPHHPAITDFLERRQQLLDRLGLRDVPLDGFGGEHGDNLVFLPKAFQIAPETFDDDRFAFVGPCLEGPAPVTDDQEVSWRPPDDGRDVVLLSLGSSYTPGQGAFLRSCVEELAGSPWRVVVTLGHRVAVEELGPLPPNVEAHQWLRYPDVLRHAVAFVTHAGMGSLMESLTFGVPVVLVPYHVDQRVIATRAAELGLGRVLYRETTGPGALPAAIEEVAYGDRTRTAVAEMRGHIEKAGGAQRGADFVESLMAPATPTDPAAPDSPADRPTTPDRTAEQRK
ncbi:macrolide family glycosyltransferase [Streptomyces sp. NPDC005438]|uniref:macrolide family glycosyltransferase n=1 Tax=Streptomyces sp. NPDC005438 TaxID=3156880 RepID=UPI0033A8CE79